MSFPSVLPFLGVLSAQLSAKASLVAVVIILMVFTIPALGIITVVDGSCITKAMTSMTSTSINLISAVRSLLDISIV